LNTKLEKHRFDNVQEIRNNFNKIVYEVADGIFSNVVLFRLRDAIDKVIRKNSVAFERVEDVLTKFLLLG